MIVNPVEFRVDKFYYIKVSVNYQLPFNKIQKDARLILKE